MTNWFGLYRAVVVRQDDPTGTHRLLLRCPQLWGDGEQWAMGCVPAGISLVLPGEGAVVWIQFEAGDSNRPVWLGMLP